MKANFKLCSSRFIGMQLILLVSILSAACTKKEASMDISAASLSGCWLKESGGEQTMLTIDYGDWEKKYFENGQATDFDYGTWYIDNEVVLVLESSRYGTTDIIGVVSVNQEELYVIDADGVETHYYKSEDWLKTSDLAPYSVSSSRFVLNGSLNASFEFTSNTDATIFHGDYVYDSYSASYTCNGGNSASISYRYLDGYTNYFGNIILEFTDTNCGFFTGTYTSDYITDGQISGHFTIGSFEQGSYAPSSFANVTFKTSSTEIRFDSSGRVVYLKDSGSVQSTYSGSYKKTGDNTATLTYSYEEYNKNWSYTMYLTFTGKDKGRFSCEINYTTTQGSFSITTNSDVGDVAPENLVGKTIRIGYIYTFTSERSGTMKSSSGIGTYTLNSYSYTKTGATTARMNINYKSGSTTYIENLTLTFSSSKRGTYKGTTNNPYMPNIDGTFEIY